ncbi:MFS transporter [Paenibacillus sp. J2TS4]|uniref:MFS transporter n=1 Tax=Paenibacillus sp. J2TS4 TaxID=2807194 RepID=UPI001B18FBE6|nr:MFS transporter [Paenibacillus sp. J2TS4]GIP31701.1 putative MFS-type transporter YbcL [Paenibacillus sp. J2TS4]
MKSWSVYLLTVGVFLAGTAEYMIAGVLNMVSTNLQISIALAGQLVTAYALANAIGAPVIVMLTARADRKKVMIGAMCLFTAGNLIAWWSPNFAVLLGSRILLGLSGGIFTVVAMSTVSKLVPPGKLGNAIGILTMGLSGSLVFGVPLGVALSGWVGWRAAFSVLAAANLLIMIGIARLIPALPGRKAIPFKQQSAIFRNRKVVSGFFMTLFWIGGYAVAYTFLTPFLRETVNMDTAAISMTLFVLGVFAMLGSRLGGYGADRWGVVKTVVVSLIIHAVALSFLPLLNGTMVSTIMIIAIWIGSAWMTSPTLQTYFIQQNPQSPDLALSLNTSVLQLGIAMGAGFGGIVVNATGTVTTMPWIGAGVVILALAAAAISFSLRPSRGSEQGKR